jgi:hypothetical protein
VRRGHAPAGRLALVLTLAALAACGGLESPFGKPARERPEPVVNRSAADAEAARDYLASLQALQSAAPATQAEVFQSARLAAENAPTTMNRLRYALMLALPGHAAADPVAARRQLSELLARPELLLPAERALGAVLLASVDERLVLVAENRRLEQDATARDRDRSAAAARRLQSEQDENARLRRALEDAQKKLDAVTQVERSITGRGNPPKP